MICHLVIWVCCPQKQPNTKLNSKKGKIMAALFRCFFSRKDLEAKQQEDKTSIPVVAEKASETLGEQLWVAGQRQQLAILSLAVLRLMCMCSV